MFRQRITAALLAISLLAWSPFALAAQNTLTTPGAPLTMAQLATFLNNAFTTVGTNYSGATPPAVCTGGTACQYQFWLDSSTSPKVLRIYDGASWVAIGNLDTSGHSFSIASSEPTTTQSGASYTFADTDKGSLVRRTNSGAMTDTLPAPAGASFSAGWFVDVRSTTTGTDTITSGIGSTIDGAATLVLPPGRGIRIVSDGANYFTGPQPGTPTTAVLGGVFSKAAVGSNWFRSLGTDGNFTASQPACADLSTAAASCSTDTTNASNISSGTLGAARLPAFTGDATVSVGTSVIVINNLPTGTTMAGSVLATVIVAPGTPAAGKASVYVDSTTKALTNKDDAGTLHTTIIADTGASNQFLTAISAAGVISKAQPSFTNLSGSLACSQHPALTGDVTTSAGNCATTVVNLPTGTTMAGSVLATNIVAPGTPASGKTSIYVDSTDKRLHDKNDAGTIGTTVVADTGAANNYISAISAAGVITKSRPTCSTLSDSTSSCSTANATANTPSTIVARDGSGNFSAGTISAALTGNASTATALQTARAIYGNNFDGTAALAQIIASTFGGTGNGFTKFSGPSASEKTFTLPNASAAILTDNAAVTVAQGGTSQGTALGARSSAGLNIEACTSTGDANYTILLTDRCVYHTALSAARTDTLPAANALNPGQGIYISDFRGVATGSNTLTLQRAGADTINGGSTLVVVNAQYGMAYAVSDGSSRWTILSSGSGGGGGGVSSVACANGVDCATITTSGTVKGSYRHNFMLPL